MRCYIYIFRHGQSTYNRDKMFTGLIDAPLTQRGRKDAKKIARRLKNSKFEISFRSSLKRSKDTLNYVLKSHPECKKIIVDDRITERDYGRLSGKTHDEIISQYGKKQYNAWHRGFDTRPPGGESFADVEKRVGSFVKDIVKLIKKRKVNVVISAHGNSIRLFRKIMEKKSRKECVRWRIPEDNYYKYSIKV